MNKLFFIKKVIFLILFSLFCSFSSASTITAEGCVNLASTPMSISIIYQNGGSLQDVSKILQDKDFKKLPEDFQELIKLLIEVVFTSGPKVSSTDHYKAFAQFCMLAKGDIPIMNKLLHQSLGHTTL